MRSETESPSAGIPPLRSASSLIALPLFITGLLSLFVVSSLGYFHFRKQTDQELFEKAQTIADSVRIAAATTGMESELHRFVSALGANPAVDLVVVASERDAKVVACTRHEWLGKSLDAIPGPEVAEDLKAALALRRAHHTSHAGGAVFDYTIPLVVSRAGEASERGAVMIHINVARVRSQFQSSYLTFTLLMLGAVTITTGVAVTFLRRHVVYPLYAVTRQLASRERDAMRLHLPPGSARELAEIVRALNVAADLSRKQEQELTATIEHLHRQRYAVDQHCLVAVTDDQGVILEVNDHFCRVSGYTRDELIGRTHRVVSSGAHPPEFFAALWQTLRSGGVWRGEICNRSKNGNLFWEESTILPLTLADGVPQQYIAIRTDITHLKRVEEELIQSRQEAEGATAMKSEFIATMSHEIRTPMNGILGFSDLLIDSNLSPQALVYARMLKRSAEGLLVLVNDILDYSKIEAGKLVLERLEFDPTSIAHEALQLMLARAHERGLKLYLDVSADCPGSITGDPVRVRQVVLNLLNNAVKFTEHGSVTAQITSKRSEAGASICITVVDTGIGIPREQLERLFERFVQAESSTTRRFGGSGLGLSICKHLAEAMGGNITVTSEPGVGSRFSLNLPVDETSSPTPQHPLFWGRREIRITDLSSAGIRAEDAPALSPARAMPKSPASEPLRVLIVDDTEANRMLAAALLEKMGAQTAEASDGQSAVELARAERFDLILMDCHMPRLDGCEATRQIRGLEGARGRVPIVALSASTEDRERCLASGMNDFLAKPVRKADLVEMVRKHSRARETGVLQHL